MIKLNQDRRNYEILIWLTITNPFQKNINVTETRQLIRNPINQFLCLPDIRLKLVKVCLFVDIEHALEKLILEGSIRKSHQKLRTETKCNSSKNRDTKNCSSIGFVISSYCSKTNKEKAEIIKNWESRN